MSHTAADFLAAVRGIPTHHVTKVLTLMTPGVIWARSTKASMADCYERSNDPRPERRRAGYYQLRNLDLDLLARRARARQAGDYDWNRIK